MKKSLWIIFVVGFLWRPCKSWGRKGNQLQDMILCTSVRTCSPTTIKRMLKRNYLSCAQFSILRRF